MGERLLGLVLGLDVFGQQDVVDIVVSVAFLAGATVGGPDAVNNKLEITNVSECEEIRRGLPLNVWRSAGDFIVSPLGGKRGEGKAARMTSAVKKSVMES